MLADNGGAADHDPNGDPLTVALASDVANGTLTLNANGSFSYTPDPDFAGSDSFVYQVSDGKGGTDLATVTLTGTPVDDPARASATATPPRRASSSPSRSRPGCWRTTATRRAIPSPPSS